MMQTAVVIGVGAQAGLGAALCARFAREGFHVLVAGRTASKVEAVVASIQADGGSAEAVVVDATKAEDIVRLFDLGMASSDVRQAVSLVAFNAGDNQFIRMADLMPEQFERFWRVGCYAGFLVASEVARRMAPLGCGTVLFTGASGSMRGRAGFAHFAAAKAGLRMVSQSLARELGPQGIHVAHVVIDCCIDGERLRKAAPQVAASKGDDGLMNVDAIADAYWHVHTQHRSAWTQELDLRPFKEMY
jgi:NAD(P)-dependent dehydrogenase (short-subunit alcohol dehydrogenase family)